MKFFLFIVFLSYGTHLWAQEEMDKIFWEKDGLTWVNFEAQPDVNSAFHANTSAGLSYSWGLKNSNGVIELEYEVKSYFNRKGSWVKSGSKKEDLLKHEQVHFDITELHARKLRKKLSEINVNALGKEPREVLNNYYKAIEKERSLMQQKYDRETNHSLNKNAQLKWQEYVERELNKYEETAV